MGIGIVTALYYYERIFKQYPWRWKALITIMVGFILSLFVISNHPLVWIIVHLTLDPQTGFFRIGTWNFALPLISDSPIIGRGLAQLGDSSEAFLFLWSVDCLWLVEALRYGLPAVILLLLTMFSPFLRRRRMSTFGPGMDNMPTGVSLAIIAMVLIGLTVHFWDATWLFLNLCVGIRASLAEYEAGRQASHLG
jgi:hypothetical protein